MSADIKPIRNLADHDAAIAEVERLWGAANGTAEADRLEIYTQLIQAFEQEYYKPTAPDPIAAIEFRMDQQGLTRKDLEPILGSRARVSEVMNGKRGLSLRMIRALHEKLGISLEVLIQPMRRDAA